MYNVSKTENSNKAWNCHIVSTKTRSLRYNVSFTFFAALIALIGSVSSMPEFFSGNVVAQTTGICDRTHEVADAVVAEIQNTRPDATCADITENELASIEGPLNVAPSALKPGDFDGLNSLTELEITGQHLTVLKSDIFSGLVNLETLEVKSPSLSTIHSGAFKGLAKIKALRLQGNNIRAVPRETFQGLGNLEILRLYGDGIKSLPIGLFSGLERLRALDLHIGGVENLTHGVMAGMPNLRALHFRNEATEALESGAFSGLGNLQALYLEGSGITKMGSDAFAGLHNLRQLHLNDNQITSLPQGVFRHLTSLTHLHLHDNALETFPSGTFDGLGRLRELYLHDNNFARLPADIFQGVDSLEIIHLDQNKLTEVPNELVQGLTELRELTFYANELTDVSDLDLSDSGKLEWIDFDGNQGVALPEDLFTAPPCSLKTFGFAGSESGGVPTSTIDGVTLNILDALPQPSKNGCGSEDGITDLWIDGAALTGIELATIRKDFTKLEVLSMTETELPNAALTHLLEYLASPNLDRLNLSSNDLSYWNDDSRDTIAEAISRHENLATLELEDTGIDGETALAILENIGPKVGRISFADNNLSGWNDPEVQSRLGEAFSKLPEADWWFIDLDEASLDSTAAATILTNAARISGERDYVRVRMTDNEITEIDAAWFDAWEVLSDLHLSNNQITKFDPAVLSQFADTLRFLYLDGNPLDPVPPVDAFEAALPNLEELELPEPIIPETPEVSEPQRLPITGGNAPSINGAAFLLMLGLTMIFAALAFAPTFMRTRSRR